MDKMESGRLSNLLFRMTFGMICSNSQLASAHPFLSLLGCRQANLCFHFAESAENLPDIAKSRDASMDNKEFSSFSRF